MNYQRAKHEWLVVVGVCAMVMFAAVGCNGRRDAVPRTSAGSTARAEQCRLEPVQDKVLESQVPVLVIPHLAKAPDIDGVLNPDEWAGAGKTDAFLLPLTTQTVVPRTWAWAGVDDRKLYVAFRCELKPGTEPKADVKKHDKYLFNDDSVEVFCWPGISQPWNYHFGVNSTGVRFDAKKDVDLAIGRCTSSDKKWNPSWDAKSARIPNGWTVEMAIPLSELKIQPKGIRTVRLNFCRNIRPGKDQRSSWAYLTNTRWHVVRDYGLGVCTFGVRKGKSFTLSGDIGREHPGLLRWTKKATEIALLPAPCEVALRLPLPDEVFSRIPILVKPTLAPILPGGKEGKPQPIGSFRLKSGKPVRLTVGGLRPGNFQLCVNVTGMGVSLSRKFLLQVRKPIPEFTIKGKPVLSDSDWRVAGKVANAKGVEHGMTPEVLLKTEFKKPVFAFDPTEDETLTCMTGYKGKLYLGSCTKPAMTDTGSVFAYDPDLDVWKKSFQVNEQGLVRMKVYGDTLYIPGYDANDGGWDLGNIYLHDGKEWIERRTVPWAVHIYGLAVYRGRIYVSAGIFDAPPEGMPYKEAIDKGLIDIYGRVVSSGDGGKTWREEYRGSTPGQDVGYMTVFKDQLILNAHGGLVVFDGKTWRALDLNPKVLFVFDYAVDGDTLIMGTPFGICFYDGKRFWRSTRFRNGHMRGIARFGDHWVLVDYDARGFTIGHGPGRAGYPGIAEDAKKMFWNFIQVVPPDILHERDLRAEDRKKGFKWWEQAKWVRSDEMLVSCRVFRGRLYLGTHPEGRVLVLPVVKEGFLESSPREIAKPGAHRLWWRGAAPPGTSIRFQVRTVATREKLTNAPYVGPDGTSETFFEKCGTSFPVKAPGFIQYRAVLTTNDPARTPYLKQVVITQDG